MITNKDYYDQRQHLEGARKLGYNSSYNQSLRYGILTKDLDLSGKSCLLLGCGEGAGVPFLQSKGCKNIFGADLVDRHIKSAKELYPDLKDSFYEVSSTKDAFARCPKVDWVIASGTWNVKSEDPYQKITDLFYHLPCRAGLATNFTTGNEDKDICSYCPVKVLGMVMKKFDSWRMDYTYLPNDFSIWGWNSSRQMLLI